MIIKIDTVQRDCVPVNVYAIQSFILKILKKIAFHIYQLIAIGIRRYILNEQKNSI